MSVGITVEKLVGGLFSRRQKLFKTFIKVRYALSAKICQEVVFVEENFCHLVNISSFFADEKFFLRYNEYI